MSTDSVIHKVQALLADADPSTLRTVKGYINGQLGEDVPETSPGDYNPADGTILPDHDEGFDAAKAVEEHDAGVQADLDRVAEVGNEENKE